MTFSFEVWVITHEMAYRQESTKCVWNHNLLILLISSHVALTKKRNIFDSRAAMQIHSYMLYAFELCMKKKKKKDEEKEKRTKYNFHIHFSQP